MVVGSSRGVAAKVLDSDIVVNEFKLQSHGYGHFRTYVLGKGLIPWFQQAISYIVPQVFCNKNGFGIK